METSALPKHVQEQVSVIAEFHALHERQASRSHRFIGRIVRWVGRPRFIWLLTVIIAFWIGVNLVLLTAGKAFDPPPFQLLQDIAQLVALYITVLILITASREKEIGEHRDQLTLQLAMLNDQKSAKIIELLEQLRRDDPSIHNRVDDAADALSVPVDPTAVLNAIKGTQGEAQPPVKTERPPRTSKSSG